MVKTVTNIDVAVFNLVSLRNDSADEERKVIGGGSTSHLNNKGDSDVGDIVMSVAEMASPTCQTCHQNRASQHLIDRRCLQVTQYRIF